MRIPWTKPQNFVRQNLKVLFEPAEQLEKIHTIEKVEISPESALPRKFHLKFNRLLVEPEKASINERATQEFIFRLENGVNLRTKELTNTISQLPYDRQAQIQSSYLELIQKSNDIFGELRKLLQST